MKDKTIGLEAVIRFGSETYNTLARILSLAIQSDKELNLAFARFCAANNRIDKDFLPMFVDGILVDSCTASSEETEEDGNVTVYGNYNLYDALFAARVKLLGLPEVTNYIKATLAPMDVRTNFFVMDGELQANVELEGERSNVLKHLRYVRDCLRAFGFGHIETVLENEVEEPAGSGWVSIPVLASRPLP